jgi:O-succinylbenzoate synthase
MVEKACSSTVSLAHDESVSRKGMPYWIGLGWQGYWVIKPSLMGSPESWMQLPGLDPEKVVLSSVFESGIGLSALIRLAARFNTTSHGFGTTAFFDDGLGVAQSGGQLASLEERQEESIWNQLYSD